MAHLEITFHDKTMDIRGQGFSLKFPDVGKNKKGILPIIRAFSTDTGETLYTYQEIADAFGYKARQNVENFVAEFHANGDNLQQYLSPKNGKHERLCGPIADQILTNPEIGNASAVCGLSGSTPG